MAADCQICGNGDCAPLVTQQTHRWHQCPACDFAFLDPMPAEDTATDDAIGHSYIANQTAKFDKKMRRSLRRVRRLARRMPGPRLLDVGANIGTLVGAARQVGLDPVGLEPNGAMIAAARQRFPDAEFVEGLFEQTDLGTAAFDGVYTSEVIEHVREVNPFVANLARVLRPGGALYLTTPGLHEYAKGGDPSAWRDFGAPDHKLYFSRGNIRRLLADHGFTRIRLQANFGRGIKLFATRR